MSAMPRGAAAILLAAVSVSCTSIADLEPYPLDAGTREQLQVPSHRGLPALRASLDAIGVRVAKDVQPVAGTQVWYGTTGPFLDRQGEILRVVARASGEYTEFHVLAEKRMTTNPCFKSSTTYAQELRDAAERALGSSVLEQKYGLDGARQ